MNQEAKFRYTFPIAKSEQRSDGNYLIGYASGPEVDSEMERMAPNAIQGFSDQINASSDAMRLVYRDAHAPDGVLRDLGEITKAWVNEKMHLGIEVRLDMENPAAAYLWKQINNGKQYGMSVAGRVFDYIDEFVAEVGGIVRTYKQIILDEISNTTRPAWYPSFGSVLAKSIKDAESDLSTSGQSAKEVGTEDNQKSAADSGENTLDNEELLDATVKGATESDSADGSTDVKKYSMSASDAASASYALASILGILGNEDSPEDAADAATLREAVAALQAFISSEVTEIGTEMDKSETSEDTSKDVIKSDDESAGSADDAETSETTETPEAEKSETDETEVEKAGKKLSASSVAELKAMFDQMQVTLSGLGVLDEAKSSEETAPETDEETIDKSAEDTEVDELAVLKAQVADLQKSNQEATARIAELAKTPRTDLPPLITDETKKSAEDDFAEAYKNASPHDRLRLAMAAKTRGL